jgi:hypothetical protein
MTLCIGLDVVFESSPRKQTHLGKILSDLEVQGHNNANHVSKDIQTTLVDPSQVQARLRFIQVELSEDETEDSDHAHN